MARMPRKHKISSAKSDTYTALTKAPKYLTEDSTDKEIEAAIERARHEWYRAWYEYIKDFD